MGVLFGPLGKLTAPRRPLTPGFRLGNEGGPNENKKGLAVNRKKKESSSCHAIVQGHNDKPSGSSDGNRKGTQKKKRKLKPPVVEESALHILHEVGREESSCLDFSARFGLDVNSLHHAQRGRPCLDNRPWMSFSGVGVRRYTVHRRAP